MNLIKQTETTREIKKAKCFYEIINDKSTYLERKNQYV